LTRTSPTGGVGKASEFPYVLTTHRLGEHWHAGGQSRSVPWLMETQPAMYIEMSPELADELGVKSGDFVRVTSGRTSDGIIIKANVTKRLRPLVINGKSTHILAMPWHFAFKRYKYDGIPFNQGMRSPTDKISANLVTIDAIDASAHIPETKACLINVEKV
jgi:formate dehydrogenase major subunit